MSYSLRRHRLLSCSVAILAFGTSAPTIAYAQNATQLEQITVEGGGVVDSEEGNGIEPVNGVVAKSTRTGSKAATPITEIPQSVSVVGRDEIDAQGAQKADEALRYTSGVFTQPFGEDTDMNWMYIRGFDATQTGVYLDGLQTYNYAFASFFIDSWNLERIEVLKGPASVLYGGSNPGGVINYVSKRPDFERTRHVADVDGFECGVGLQTFEEGAPGMPGDEAVVTAFGESARRVAKPPLAPAPCFGSVEPADPHRSRAADVASASAACVNS